MIVVKAIFLLILAVAVVESSGLAQNTTRWVFSGFANCNPAGPPSDYLIVLTLLAVDTFDTRKCGSAVARQDDGSFYIECQNNSTDATPQLEILHGCGGMCLFWWKGYSEPEYHLNFTLSRRFGEPAVGCRKE
ncbi:unnamed protein product [Bursaphelenchus xylophilus]|uniref:(pine wood nematode) hypothetical protein n=1 Tax=Bursaphelenchus xylophilus TaxID=6326 RepID=A0A1I7SIL9_BURXY|nr:unnamed protein product [Bursaphelenchus xylophilus]CAG9082110.1 unnamed protein product [Bursaphelenchus xylophilus]